MRAIQKVLVIQCGENSNHRTVLEDDSAGGCILPTPAGVADGQQSSFIGDALEGANEDIATYGIEYDVGAAPFRGLIDCFREIRRADVDCQGSAQLKTRLGPLLARGGSDDLCAECTTHLNGSGSNATGPTVNEQRF